MGHKFDPAQMVKLDSQARRKLLPPEATIAKLGITPGSVVADIGCGTGYFTFPLSWTVGREGLVLGIDISEEMLNEARRRLAQEREKGAPDNVRFLLSRENELPLEGQQVDVVFLSTVLHELAQPEVFFREIHRILSNQGKVMVVEWKKAAMEMGPPEKERLSAEEASRLLEASGFITQAVLDLGEAHYGIIATMDKGGSENE